MRLAPELTTGLARVRRPGPLAAIALAYVVAVTALMTWRGIMPTPDYLLLLLTPLALLTGRFLRWLRDWVPFVALLLAWEAMRGLADGVTGRVYLGSLRPELWLFGGRLPTLALQGWLDRGTLGSAIDHAAAAVYFAHFPYMLGVGLLLWIAGREVYRRYAIALLGMAMAAFVVFLTFPTAPPWYAADHGIITGLHHVLAEVMPRTLSPYYTSLDPNPVAAVPSLHAAVPVLGFLALRGVRRWASWLALAWCAVVWFTIVYLGEHYVLDAVTGAAFACGAWALASAPEPLTRIARRIQNTVSTRPPIGAADGVEGGVAAG
jgi:hypothetical protein